MDEPLLRKVDAVTLAVPDLDAGLDFYIAGLGHELAWRNDDVGQAGLRCPDSDTEIVLSVDLAPEADWLVASVQSALEAIVAAGGVVVSASRAIPVGHVAVVEDPFGNRLVLVDLGAGRYATDASGATTGLEQA